MEKQIIKGSELVDKELEVQEDGTLRIVEKGRFIPRHEEFFWYVMTTGLIANCCFDKGCREHYWIIKYHPIFKTEEECKEYRRYLLLLDEYMFEPDWNDEGMGKWYIYYDHESKEIDYDCFQDTQSQGYYFASEERAMEFIEKVGESNVKKFTFDIWE